MNNQDSGLLFEQNEYLFEALDIELDKGPEAKYSKNIQSLILESKVIELGSGENSLYGKSFAVK
ncbi:hypothetical protein [Treponema sp.]|uniref:hypothetical protein n=1 Tax=Treponema sp. TaxID=166 RepID=UPI00298DD180|nr:hypothetical protein [Treponema sp.]MCQ2240239.1 hypothetical protein [Treponema sp.]